MSQLPCALTKSDTEFLKQVRDDVHTFTARVHSLTSQLHGRLSSETYFGTKEFTLVYYIAETLSTWSPRYCNTSSIIHKKYYSSNRLKHKYQVKENFVDVLASFMVSTTSEYDIYCKVAYYYRQLWLNNQVTADSSQLPQ